MIIKEDDKKFVRKSDFSPIGEEWEPVLKEYTIGNILC